MPPSKITQKPPDYGSEGCEKCDAVYEKHARDHGRAAAEAIRQLISGEPAPPNVQMPDSTISWDAWNTDWRGRLDDSLATKGNI